MGAYDIATKQCLNVQVYPDAAHYQFYLPLLSYDSLVYLGNGILCLLAYCFMNLRFVRLSHTTRMLDFAATFLGFLFCCVGKEKYSFCNISFPLLLQPIHCIFTLIYTVILISTFCITLVFTLQSEGGFFRLFSLLVH